MRLLVDLQAAQSIFHPERGIARYATDCARALVATEQVDRLLLNPALPFPSALPTDLLASPLLAWSTAAAVESVGDDAAYLVLSPMEGVKLPFLLPPHISRRGWPVVVVVHDLIPSVMGETYLEGWRRRVHHQRLELVDQADLVLTNSDFTRSDVIHHLGIDPGRVVTIGAGTSDWFAPAVDPALPVALLRQALPQITRPFVLSVAAPAPHKNLPGLVRAWARLPDELRRTHQLVVACRMDEPSMAVIVAVGLEEGLRDDEVVLTGYVTDEVLRALYQTARLFVFASLYEGFGLPVAEALRCGCPAVTSATTSLPEILRWPPATFRPDEPADVARVVAAGLAEGPFRDELAVRGAARTRELTWTAVATRVVQAVDELDQGDRRPPRARRATRPRVAVVGSLSPGRTGLAEVNGLLLDELARLADVVAFDSADSADSADGQGRGPQDRGYERASLPMLGNVHNPWSFDHLVYILEDTTASARAIDALRRHPGVAWLHDVRLTRPAWAAAMHHPDPDRFWGRRLAELYPIAAGHLRPNERESPEALDRRGMGMTGGVVADCTGLLVGSRAAARLLAFDQRPGSVLPPLEVLAPPLPQPPLARQPEQDPPLLVALGPVGQETSPLVLVEALALIRQHRPAQLAFVGPVDGPWTHAVARMADAIGLSSHVRSTGAVADEERWGWVARASIGVQLGRPAGGGSPGSITDLLALGVPCAAGAAVAAELPPGTVVQLPPGGSAGEVARTVLDLLGDPDQRAALARAGRAEAERRTFSATAAELLAALDRLRAAGR